MRNLVLLVLMFLLVRCNSTLPVNQDDNVENVSENIIVGELIGNALSTVKDRESELNIKFDFQVVKEYVLDIDNDNKEDKIIVERIKEWNDPGDFHRIRIKKGNGKEFEFFNGSGWIVTSNYETQYINDFASGNLINSEYIILQNAGVNNILLFAFGYVYASKPGKLCIVNLSMENEPKLIFNKNCYLYEFKDLNNDKTKDVLITKYDKYELINNEGSIKAYNLNDGWLHVNQ